ncbi:MAG: tRNA (adenosine(37)-N6)-dimethylallyltransferase MiaA [Myxococcales bacterium]|nr:tRNA (adenosine(37)-N6)-dimethylallyltransferase MiaA [Myxococcales bacterium]
MKPIIIAGPTGSGKSALALKWAKKYGGEIICADSRQFYQHMHIGTASPSKKECEEVPHHGFNCVDPSTTKVDAGYFVAFAKKTINEIQERGMRPIIVGGTGLYLRALRYGTGDVPKSNPQIVQELEEECDRIGLDKLYQELIRIDKNSAEFIRAQDRYRIIRALEIYRQTGKAPSKIRQSFYEKKTQLKARWIMKFCVRDKLLEKLKSRVERMFDEGLLNEAKALRNIVGVEHWALNVMGYHEALLVIDNKISLEEAQERVFIRHRQYSKQQTTWFKKEQFYRWHI